MTDSDERGCVGTILRQLADAGVVPTKDMSGYSEDDLLRLETLVGLRLPTAYREFLRLVGHGAGWFYGGTHALLPPMQLARLREWADELVKEMGLAPLPQNAMVFWMHQGYKFRYFECSECDDPPVFHFHEDKPTPAARWSRFSEMLADDVRDCIQICNKIRSRSGRAGSGN